MTSKRKVTLYRGQVGSSKGLDVTVKSASGEQSKKLAPTWEMVLGVKSGNVNETDFTKMYYQQLEGLGREFWVALGGYARSLGSAVTFLCYCPDSDASGRPYFCHTRLIIAWLTDHKTYSKWFQSGLED